MSFTLSYTDQGQPTRVDIDAGEMLVGRGLACAIVLSDSSVSRQHAILSVHDGRLLVRDVGSRFGTFRNTAPITGTTELSVGDTLVLGRVPILVGERTPAVALDDQHLIDDSATVFRPVLPPASGDRGATAPAADAGRLLTLLSDIAGTLVLVDALPQVFKRIVDLVFTSIPAERAVLLLRDATGAIEPAVARTRDGIEVQGARVSRTVIARVMSERVSMLSADTAIDPRVTGALSLRAANARSFMCAPLWNRSAVIGVVYVDNPAAQQFTPGDLDVLTALANYAAVAIERARLGDELLGETKRRERLQRYHSPSVVSRILDPAGDLEHDIAAHARDVSVMFVDIVGFTALSERLGPADTVSLLCGFFETATDVIFEHDGTVDKFIGDCVMAVFGAPYDQPDHARRCIDSARQIMRALDGFNREIAPVSLQLRIAINSGTAMVGDVGSTKRREFTVLGDVVNAASRLEHLANPGQILISGATRSRAGDDVPVRPLGRTTLRGQSAEIELFDVPV